MANTKAVVTDTLPKGRCKIGWNWLYNSRKWHYFGSDGVSACRKYMTLSDNTGAEEGNESSPDNCKACLKALKQIRLKESKH